MLFSLTALLAVEPATGCATSNTATIQSRISGMLEGSERADAEKALGTALSYAPQDSREAIARIPESLDRGRALAHELGEDNNEVNAVNFAYGIVAVGEHNVRELHQQLGMRFFMRYSRTTLRELVGNLSESDSRPLLVAAFNKNDWNSAFYREGMGIETLMRYYRVIIVEVSTEGELYDRIRSVPASSGRINTLLIAGHGQADSVQLGAPDEAGRIDTTDGTELEGLRDHLAAHPLIVLISCSTGESDKAVGHTIADGLRAVVYAPVTPSTRTVFHLDSSGRIERVSYDVDTRRFVGTGS
jgi:hypothetical protein